MDESWWARAWAGDEEAFSVLFDRHYARVFRHAMRLVDQAADADEVAAATSLTLWRQRTRVRVVGGSVLPWLLVTAGNLARNDSRRLQRCRRLLDRLPRDPESADPAEVVAEQDEQARRRRALTLALARLPKKDARLVELTALGEPPVSDAAELLGLTPGAARVRLHRARRKLRDLVDFRESYDVKEEWR